MKKYILPPGELLENSKSLKEIICSEKFRHSEMQLPIVIGADENGMPVVTDLVAMPHLIIGSDTPESLEYLNTLILSLLFRKTPEELKLVILDPTQTELKHYSALKEDYLASTPCDLDAREHPLRQMLKTVVCVQAEMDRRYQIILDSGAYNFREYNSHQEAGGKECLPYIVMIVNDYQSLAAFFDKRVESPIAAIAQKGCAVGIHVVLLTRSFHTGVISGILKANFPGRISFKTENSVDSKMILDRGGAEKLPAGYMLAFFDGSYRTAKCAMCPEADCDKVISYISAQTTGRAAYLLPDAQLPKNGSSRDTKIDPFLKCAIDYATSKSGLSVAMLQRCYTIGYNRATRLMDAMVEVGVVAKDAVKGKHKVLIEPKDITRVLNSLSK